MSLNFSRSLSTRTPLLREWRLVEQRKVAAKPVYQVGDAKPHYIPKQKPKFPDYPYGESHIFKQSNAGLYGASFIQHGNSIAESKVKVRRTWLPNVIKKGLWSETLDRKISVKMTAKVLRTITKEGGIDNYLTKDKAARVKELGPTGWKLRYRVLTKQEQLANPPHKNAETVTVDGKDHKVYYTETVGGETYRITVGRRKLLSQLFVLEKLEHKANSKTLEFRQFLEMYENSSVNEILSKLKEYGYNLAQISV